MGRKEHLVNLIPHPMTILDEDNKVEFELPPCEEPPRVEEESKRVGTCAGVPILEKRFGEVDNLPRPRKGVSYIVPVIVARATDRYDLLVPNTVRDEEGNIMGCRSFSRIP